MWLHLATQCLVVVDQQGAVPYRIMKVRTSQASHLPTRILIGCADGNVVLQPVPSLSKELTLGLELWKCLKPCCGTAKFCRWRIAFLIKKCACNRLSGLTTWIGRAPEPRSSRQRMCFLLDRQLYSDRINELPALKSK